MAQTSSSFFFLILTLTPFLLLLSQTNGQSPTAPAPAPSGPIDIFAILFKAGNYAAFIRLLNETQIGNQINNQVNNSNEGMTVIAPTDNAFQNLPSGSLNNLTTQQQVQLCLYHVLPKYYTLDNLATASNPVRTQASGNDGKPFGLYFSGEVNQNQVNVSSGMVQTTIYNMVRKGSPLAIFQVDRVLWPKEFNETEAPTAAPKSSPADSGEPTSNGTAKSAAGPSPAKNGAGSLKAAAGLTLSLFSMFCMGLLF